MTAARVVRVFYQQSKSIRQFRTGATSPFRTTYFRILAIASIDIILTLPIGIANIVLVVALLPAYHQSLATLPFYQGWNIVHRNFHTLISKTRDELEDSGPYTLPQIYFTYATTPVLAFCIFCLFGLTQEARDSYWRALYTLCGKLTCVPRGRMPKRVADVESLDFDIPPRPMTLDTETG